eukprot:14268064-Ditylum_brightwellii.AAC.1
MDNKKAANGSHHSLIEAEEHHTCTLLHHWRRPCCPNVNSSHVKHHQNHSSKLGMERKGVTDIIGGYLHQIHQRLL